MLRWRVVNPLYISLHFANQWFFSSNPMDHTEKKRWHAHAHAHTLVGGWASHFTLQILIPNEKCCGGLLKWEYHSRHHGCFKFQVVIESSMTWMIWRLPPFQETPIWLNPYLSIPMICWILDTWWLVLSTCYHWWQKVIGYQFVCNQGIHIWTIGFLSHGVPPNHPSDLKHVTWYP